MLIGQDVRLISESLPLYDVFISHNMAEERLAKQVNDWLASEGLRTFFAQYDLLSRPERAVHAEVYRALSRSAVMLLCVGIFGLGPSQRLEIRLAKTLAENGRLKILPMLLGAADRDCVPKDLASLAEQEVFRHPPVSGLPSVRDLARSLKGRRAAAGVLGHTDRKQPN